MKRAMPQTKKLSFFNYNSLQIHIFLDIQSWPW